MHRRSSQSISVRCPGGSPILQRWFVTYTKEQKSRALGVSAEVLVEAGAVCRAVAVEMANGALAHSSAHLSAAITGVAGPDPDEDGNPVGKLCVAAIERDGSVRSASLNSATGAGARAEGPSSKRCEC